MAVTDVYYDPDAHEPLPEGEEAPPPLVRTMAVVRWALFGGMILFALVMFLGHFGLNPLAAADQAAVQYHCPMHPTYISNQPGECPICGMNLVPIGTPADTATAMPPSRQGVPSAPAAAKPGQYTCPMDPDVISDQPGKCPKCGMNLVKVESTPMAHAEHEPGKMENAAPPAGGVPGLVPVTIAPERVQLIGVKTAPVERRAIDQAVRLTGFLTADETRIADLHVRTGGWVQELFADQTGQRVEAGQALLAIYSPELYQAQQDFLALRDAASQLTTDSALATTRRQFAAAARERLRLLGVAAPELERLASGELSGAAVVLRSPFDGYVLDKSVVRGAYVTPDQTLFTIGDLSTVWALADVYERDLAAVRIGQPVIARLTAFPGETFPGRVGFIYPTVTAETRTLKVRMEIANPGLRLRPGMYAELTVATDTTSALVVPTSALLDGGESRYVFVVHNRTHFEPRAVNVGRRSDDWVEILNGLSENEEVVTSANFLIDSESHLRAAIAGMGNASSAEHAGHGK